MNTSAMKCVYIDRLPSPTEALKASGFSPAELRKVADNKTAFINTAWQRGNGRFNIVEMSARNIYQIRTALILQLPAHVEPSSTILVIDIDYLFRYYQQRQQKNPGEATTFSRIYTLLRMITRHGFSIGAFVGNPYLFTYFKPFITLGVLASEAVESQVHRELISSLDFPVAFICQHHEQITAASNGIVSASRRHSFIGLNNEGQISQFISSGNPWCLLFISNDVISLNDQDLPNFKRNYTISYSNSKGVRFCCYPQCCNLYPEHHYAEKAAV